MRKFFKILLYSFLTVVLLGALALGTFIYKVKYGFPIYETEAPALPQLSSDFSVLLFSKTNGFRHGEAIEAAVPAFQQMAEANQWDIFVTDNGAVFNTESLSNFDVVVWNNVSGRVLNPQQREDFRNYVESGGGFLGIHAAGDDSHQWDWYTKELLGAKFSHHSLDPHIQEGQLYLEIDTNHRELSQSLPPTWTHADEWYVFSNNPREQGKQVLYRLDENNLQMSGNMGFLVTDKDWGMGEDHPIIWSGQVGKGKSIYSALGHTPENFQEATNLQFLKNAILWAGSDDE